MKLISEEVLLEYLVEEDKNGKKEYKLKVFFYSLTSRIVMGVYIPKEILMKEVTRYNKEFINKNRAFGELGHPDGPTVNLERVSHMIKKLYPDGDNFIGEKKNHGHALW